MRILTTFLLVFLTSIISFASEEQTAATQIKIEPEIILPTINIPLPNNQIAQSDINVQKPENIDQRPLKIKVNEPITPPGGVSMDQINPRPL